jgi:hypothetical protein
MADPVLTGVRVEPGRYRHFKGGEYEVLRLGRHTETDELLVVYCPVHDPSTVWVRPAKAFSDVVERPEGACPRFERIPVSRNARRGLMQIIMAPVLDVLLRVSEREGPPSSMRPQVDRRRRQPSTRTPVAAD